tara:strand:+ start:486 stop:695 length:210 start_codon:yes stop_codon:yes gene_type:complete
MLDNIANGLLHLGWAFWGQPCDCGHNSFNAIAKMLEGSKVVEYKPMFFMGTMLTDIAIWMEERFEYVNF